MQPVQHRACPARVIARVTWPHEGGRRKWEAREGGEMREGSMRRREGERRGGGSMRRREGERRGGGSMRRREGERRGGGSMLFLLLHVAEPNTWRSYKAATTHFSTVSIIG